MKSTLLFKAMTLPSILLLALSVQAQTSDTTSANAGNSKVRIVRLSQVKGAVDIDRHIGRGFEDAITNLPIVEQTQIRTAVGVAEVEFEDNSSLRIAPDSLVEFPSLERSANGATISTVHLVKGTAYVSLVKPQSKNAPANQFTLMFGTRKIDLAPATHLRVDLEGSQAKLAVMDGVVHVTNEAGAAVEIGKKKTATFQIFDGNEPTIAKDVEKNPFDEWDQTAAKYHANVSSMAAFNSPYAYGLTDMMYYGNFVNAAGCGSMWRPYFASAAWDPYANGTWAWYSGAGYSWVSPYPWAWTPYHYGNWMYCPNIGWGWMPGGGWYGINNVAAVMPSGNGGTIGQPGGGRIARAPQPPSHAPLPSTPALVAVGTKQIPRSDIASPTSFVFRKDSAGFGVPRGTLGDLGKFSRETVNRGTASTPIYTSLPQTNRPGAGMMTPSQSMSTSIHRGSPPSAAPTYSPRDSFGGAPRAGGAVGTGGSMRSSPAPTAPAPSTSSSGATRK